MKKAVWVTVMAMALAGQTAWAARTPVHEAAESQEYGRKFGGMIGRGALNAVTCFVDVLVNVVHETQAGPPLVGTLTGIAKGTGCGLLRLGSGAVDLVTFWVPGFNGFPVSDSYENCLVTEASPVALRPSPAGPPEGRGVSNWEVPTAEPGAAQASTAAPEPAAKQRTWKK